MFFEILLGLLPGIPVYFILTKVLIGKRPVEYRTAPTAITRIIEDYRRNQLAVEGRTPPPALEKKQETETSKPVPPTLMEANYTRWAGTQAQLPLVTGGIAVLKALSDMSSLPLTVEERHSLEVLSSQTADLLSNFFNTPETIRTMPEVETALSAQLLQIEEGVGNVKVAGAENVIRNLNVGTEFIRTRFGKDEN